MARKGEALSAWITSKEAASILSQKSGHPVADAYVRRLGLRGKIDTRQIDARTKLYKRSDVESYIVSTTPGRKKKQQEDQPV